jgi:hypothetical protein
LFSEAESDAKVELVNLSNAKKGIAVIVQTSNRELIFDEGIDGKLKARVNIYGRVTSKNKTTDGFFEEKITVEMDNKSEYTKSLKNQVILRKVLELPKGKYQIVIALTDAFSGYRGIKVIKFQVPESVSANVKAK